MQPTLGKKIFNNIIEDFKKQALTRSAFESQMTETDREQLCFGPILDILTTTPFWGFFISVMFMVTEKSSTI